MNISVVILTYNEEKNIGDCLNSVLRQRYSEGEWEILVIDGNSSDNTIKIINENQKQSNKIRLVNNAKREK